MRAEELDNLTEEQLQQKANACFAAAEDVNIQLSGGNFEKLRLHLEAQFYVTALSKKRDERVARRDFRMEVGVIALIAVEIVLATVFGIVGIREGSGQTKALKDMDASTSATATSMEAVSSPCNR